MSTQPEQPQTLAAEKERARLSRWLLPALTLCVGGFLGALLVAIGLSQSNSSWSRIWSALHGTTQIDVSQPTVVNRIQQLRRLETVVYTMDKIVSGEHTSSVLPDFLAGDRLLMLVHGEVVAGIDFSDLQPGDVEISGKHVRLHLPEAEVFSTRLDSAKTRVYSRQTGLLVPTDPNLETQVRQEAERQLHDAAVADGILKTAQQNAQTTLTSLLQGLGFIEVSY